MSADFLYHYVARLKIYFFCTPKDFKSLVVKEFIKPVQISSKVKKVVKQYQHLFYEMQKRELGSNNIRFKNGETMDVMKKP